MVETHPGQRACCICTLQVAAATPTALTPQAVLLAELGQQQHCRQHSYLPHHNVSSMCCPQPHVNVAAMAAPPDTPVPYMRIHSWCVPPAVHCCRQRYTMLRPQRTANMPVQPNTPACLPRLSQPCTYHKYTQHVCCFCCRGQHACNYQNSTCHELQTKQCSIAAGVAAVCKQLFDINKGWQLP